MLSFLHQLPREGRVLSGQFTNFGRHADLRFPRLIHRATGRWPALVGVDYADFNAKSKRRHTVQWLMNAVSRARFDLVTHDDLHTAAPNRVARSYWRAGGLVTIGAHFANPANPRGGGLRDRGVDLASLLVPGTATHRRWLRQLDTIAAALAELRDAGVVVLWRPFHEMNGGWFWWGRPRPAVFARVWRHMFRYFSQTKRLDNLLWVFGPNMGNDAARYYPGDAFVDVVGLDAYTDHVDRAHIAGYAALVRTGKPFGFSEFGPHNSWNPPRDFDCRRLLAAFETQFPRICFFLAWNANWCPARNRHARRLYRSPRILNRDELPASLFTADRTRSSS